MRLIPFLILFLIIGLVFRVTDIYQNSDKIVSYALFNEAIAADEESDVDSKAQDEIEENIDDVAQGENVDANQIPAVEDKTDTVPELLRGLSLLEDESDFDMDMAKSELDVLQNLAQRREELNKKEDSLERKEAILKATETQIEQKISELVGLKQELQDLLKEQSDEERKRINSLVKIYEGMKPKDAARIMNTLETDILIDVMEKMSERRLAPVLAAMDSERAREVTTLMAERKQLPNLDF